MAAGAAKPAWGGRVGVIRTAASRKHLLFPIAMQTLIARSAMAKTRETRAGGMLETYREAQA